MSYEKFKPNCNACRLVKADPKLRARVRFATYKREEGDETLQDIAFEVGISHNSMYNHAKKHMKDTTEAVKNRAVTLNAKKQATARAKANKKLEVAFDKDDLNIVEEFEESLDEYITQGRDILSKNQMKITEKGFLMAIKIKSDIQAKKRGQDIEIMKAVYSFSSGKNKKVKDTDGTTPEGLPGGVDSGTNGSDSIYGEIAGDALAQRSKKLHPSIHKDLVFEAP